MASTWRAKAAALVLSSCVAGAGAWLYLRSRAPSEVLETRWVAPPKLAESALAARPSGFRQRPLSVEELTALGIEESPHLQHDPLCLVRYRAGIRYEFSFPEYPGGVIRAATNDYGLRGRAPLRTDRPELRVLVLGDSHTDGVCDPDEAHPARTQALLAAHGRDAEVLNTGVAGYSFHNYIGALERYAPLAPDAVVLAVYGGNDFQESLRLHHWFAGEPLPESSPAYREDVERALDLSRPAVGQCMLSLRYFADHPAEVEVAVAASRAMLAEARDQCRALGARLLLVYIPPASDVAWAHHAQVLGRVEQLLGLDERQRGAVDAIAERMLDAARELEIEALDLRPIFRAQPTSPYWSLDFHINLDGQLRVAEQVASAIERALPPGFARTAREPRPELVGATQRAESVVDSWKLQLDPTPLPATEWTLEQAQRQFAWTDSQRFDPRGGFVNSADVERRIGSDGAWPGEPAERSAAQRAVLVLGDELIATGGEPFGALLEHAGIPAIDASAAEHGPLNYLGALALHPGAKRVVVVWNCANDYVDALDGLRALTHDEGARARSPSLQRTPEWVGARWSERPREPRPAAEAGLRCLAELRRRAEALDARLLVVLARTSAGLTRSQRAEGPATLDKVTDAFSAALLEAGFEVLDDCEQRHAGLAPALDPQKRTLTDFARQKLAESIAAALR